MYSSDVFLSTDMGSEQITGKDDRWSNRVKRKELSLDDVGVASVSLSCSTKGKRSEREREGKGNNGEVLARNGTAKIGRPSIKGERKSKAKPKQKTTHLSASVNGPLGKMEEQAKGMYSSTPEVAKDRNDYNTTDMLEDPIDLSGLQLPDMDDLGGQGEDIGSWFMNIDDDGLHDNDCMGGLGIPMDDLSELNMMV